MHSDPDFGDVTSGDRKPAALLFDMDGLTVDTEPFWFRAECEVAEALGFPWAHADHLGCVGGPVAKMAQRLAERAGMAEWRDLGDRVVSTVVTLIREEGVALQPGVRSLVHEAQAHNLPIALVSGSPRMIVDAVIEQLPFAYQVVISSDDVQESKPSPDPYLAAALALGVAIGECVAFEDSQTGAQSAVASGAHVVVVPSARIDLDADLLVLSSLEGITIDRLRELFRVRR